MSPFVKRLKENNGLDFNSYTIQDVLNDRFSAFIQSLAPEFYQKLVAQHPVLALEYSVLCSQLVHDITVMKTIPLEKIKEETLAILMLSELLEHVYAYYLNVPREVKQLRQSQKACRQMLVSLGQMTAQSNPYLKHDIMVGHSFSQQIREWTISSNGYRLFFIRLKRVLNVINAFEACSPMYREFVVGLDKYTNSFISYLAWCFFLPRLSTNLFLLLKHTIPWSSMNEQERSLGWFVRLKAQLQRRWFELGNDLVWVSIGLINCFLLTGALAPVGVYLTVIFYAFDVAMVVLRASIELGRLYDLKRSYARMLQNEMEETNRKDIQDYQGHLQERMHFEMMRLGLNVASVTAIFLAMCFAIPAFVVNPVIPLIGAIWMVAICLVGFVLPRLLECYRASDNLHKVSGVVTMGFFSKKSVEKTPESVENVVESKAVNSVF